MTESIILGLIQGLGEFLPISSSAHLVIMPWIFNWQDKGLSFDVALHIGTLLAILIYFRKDWVKIIGSFLTTLSTRKISNTNERLAWFVIIGSVPGAICGALFQTYAETTFRNPLLIAGTLTFFGLLLFWQDKKAKKTREIKDMGWKDAIIIGVSQAIAIIPGVSRSGATIVAGLFQGLKREDAAKFSFFLAAPVMAGAGLIELHEIISEFNWEVLVSFITAFAVGMLAIHLLLGYVKKNNFTVFVFYRVVLALVLVTLYLTR